MMPGQTSLLEPPYFEDEEGGLQNGEQYREDSTFFVPQ